MWAETDGEWALQGMDADHPPKHPYTFDVPQDERLARRFFLMIMGGNATDDEQGLTTTMFAVKHGYKDEIFFNTIEPTEWALKLYPPGDDGKIYEVEVSPHPDQTRSKKNHDEQQYWGWRRSLFDGISIVWSVFYVFCEWIYIRRRTWSWQSISFANS